LVVATNVISVLGSKPSFCRSVFRLLFLSGVLVGHYVYVDCSPFIYSMGVQGKQ